MDRDARPVDCAVVFTFVGTCRGVRHCLAQAAQQASDLEVQAHSELERARPALDAAVAAIDCLDKASLTELKAMQKPPPGVDVVMKVVLVMLLNEKKNLSWEAGKKLMANISTFKARLESYRYPLRVLRLCRGWMGHCR